MPACWTGLLGVVHHVLDVLGIHPLGEAGSYNSIVAFRAQRTVSYLDGRVGWTVVDHAYEEQAEARAYLRWLRFGTDAAEGTARQYACRLALFFTWVDSTGRDWRSLGLDELASFMLWLQRSSTQRGGRHPTRAEVVTLHPRDATRSDRTVNYVMTVVREFYRFCARYGAVDSAVAERLGGPRPQPFLPRTMLPEGASPSRVDTRTLRKKTPSTAPKVVTEAQARAVAGACTHERDRFLVLLCWRCGLRISEAVGLHREDLHFLPSSVHLGCTVPGSHLHIRRREANENGAMAKSRRPRVIPVDREVIAAHRGYGAERDRVPEATGSDFVFVNLFAAPRGRPMTPDSAEECFERLSVKVGFRVRPHMMRHCFGSSLAAAGVAPDVIAELMGHVSITTTQIYLHPDWDRLAAAVATVGSAEGTARRTSL